MSWLSTGPWPILSGLSTSDTVAASSKETPTVASTSAGKVEKKQPSQQQQQQSKDKKEKTSSSSSSSSSASKDAANNEKGDVQNVQQMILDELNKSSESINSLVFAKKVGVDHQTVIGAVNSLSGKLMVAIEQQQIQEWVLSEEAQEISANGSHEAKVFYAVPQGGISQAEMMQKLGNSAKIGVGKAVQAKWIEINAGVLKKKVEKIEDQTQIYLKTIESNPEKPSLTTEVLNDLKKRKLISLAVTKFNIVSKGPNFSTQVKKLATDLDQNMISSGSWKSLDFKAYNFNAMGTPLDCGHLHPLLKVREEFRKIFFEMGFTEMPTNNFVESSFWNFDSLFQPQQHPARDAHDTFFLKDPAEATQFPEDYLQKVKNIHTEGGYGSVGYRYPWKIEEAKKNIMRTHTTAVSARMLYALAQEKQFRPVKYFSIDRVFRNEALDASHLAEFHQVEGLIADYDLSLGDLIGSIEAFFKKIGMNKLRFKPAYNPYTEPSMEIFGYHEGLKRWLEVGNSGIFRPEMLLPMGLPPNVSVIAWGLSLERPTMIKYHINNIRDLCGHKIDLEMVKKNPICRIEKD